MRLRSSSESTPTREVISVTEMAERLDLSRARFYELVDDGFFTPPIFLTANRRPAYTREMAERNILAKTTGIGVNGSPRIFYRRRRPNGEQSQVTQRNGGRQARPRQSNGRLASLVSSLQSLGLQSVTEEQVGQAVVELFPMGVENYEEGDVIRAIFRHLRRPEAV